MAITEQHVLEILRGIAYPGFRRDIVSLGVIRDVTVEGSTVRLTLDTAPGTADDTAAVIEEAARAALTREGVTRVDVARPGQRAGSSALKMAVSPPASSSAAAGSLAADLIPEVRHVVAVASGKGGVGKSTVAVNLAVALARRGAATGLLDADIYGPSIPLMTGIQDAPRMTADRKLIPFERFGVRLMSLGFLVDPREAVIWRGPMVMKALEQLLRDVTWGALDVLVIDLPPGTGDAQLTLSQRIRLAGAVIVTTPQDVALADAIKGVAMFRKVSVPVLGIVENMSYFDCPQCHHRSEIFGHGGGRAEAERLGVPFLGELPLEPGIRAGGDCGEPFALTDDGSPAVRAIDAIAARVEQVLAGDKPASPAGFLGRFRRKHSAS